LAPDEPRREAAAVLGSHVKTWDAEPERTGGGPGWRGTHRRALDRSGGVVL